MIGIGLEMDAVSWVSHSKSDGNCGELGNHTVHRKGTVAIHLATHCPELLGFQISQEKPET